ncbi:hypothetical protein Poly24_17790 [Rosistilla carotiformis]|uniref:Thioredoxin domain-containing protein n=1 Tax=Rosistilla carotiformis TaxID=2528017 RepID=A0A518JRB1_9BACT|nr:hypothetical protein [Rosistilla carotiformis]QDV68073.1 hypothetical protein Poly24_17790 [Rosistilla carotiformis]
MKRIFNQTTIALTMTLATACFAMAQTARAASPAEQAIQAASANNQFAFVMFYRGNDAPTQAMHGTLQTTLANRQDAVIVPVQIGDAAEQALVKHYDATRMPMPATAVLAPNGAVCSVFPQKATSQQLTAAIVSTGQAQCLKALQDRKLVLLCAQPSAGASIPMGVRQFQADKLYENRTEVVTVIANNPAEAKFLQQLRVKTDQPAPVVAFMAPPGVMVGIFNANVSLDDLAQKLAAAGKCCDDENCKHHKSAEASQPSRR